MSLKLSNLHSLLPSHKKAEYAPKLLLIFLWTLTVISVEQLLKSGELTLSKIALLPFLFHS